VTIPHHFGFIEALCVRERLLTVTLFVHRALYRADVQRKQKEMCVKLIVTLRRSMNCLLAHTRYGCL
jgi:hypothetical protein